MKLYGKELDEELVKRSKAKDERREKRITLRDACKLKNIDIHDLIAYEKGFDVCPHEEWRDMVAGFPKPKLIFKICKKCGMIDEDTKEKINDSNMERVYNVCKESMEKLSNGLKGDKNLVEK